MSDVKKPEEFILGLDVSTKTIGVALFKDLGTSGKLSMLTHISPTVKPKPANQTETIFKKAQIFREEFLLKYRNTGIKKVIIEEPLLRSNNIHTVATLLRFNGMISRDVYEILGVVPEFISSYDSRKYAFPELMAVRTTKKDGTVLSEKEIARKEPTLFGAYPHDIDKKLVVWKLVSDLEPQLQWIYDKNNKLKSESFDCSDAYTVVRAYMRRGGNWL